MSAYRENHREDTYRKNAKDFRAKTSKPMKNSTKLWIASGGLLAAFNACAFLRDRCVGQASGAAVATTALSFLVLFIVFVVAAMIVTGGGK